MKEKGTLLEKIEKFGKGNRVIATMLCVCLIMVSLPVQYIGLSVEAFGGTWGTQQEIVSFSELPEEVSRQVVKRGTPLRELELPDMLTVSCRAVGIGDNIMEEPAEVMTEAVAHTVESDMISQGMDVPVQEPAEQAPESDALILEDEETASETDVPVVESEEPVLEPEEPGSGTEELSPEPEIPSPEPEAPSPEPETPAGGDIGESKEPAEVVTESIIRDITWECTPEYDGGAEGDYVFTPVLPDTYILAEGVALPRITVTVEKSEAERINVQEIEGNLIDAEAAEMNVMNENIALQSDGILPACGTISEDTTWTAGTLSAGTVTVEPGVTLTITGSVVLDGNVTIEGGGKIVRGNASGSFNVSSVGSLTMRNITVDGASIQATTCSLIRSYNGGKVTLDDGCMISNCIRKGGAGGVINAFGSQLVIKKATIANCSSTNSSAGDGGGAIFMEQNSSLDIDGATITDCSTDTRGGVILSLTGGTINIHSGTFSNNRTTSTSNVHDLVGGGFIYTCRTELNIYGGNFIDNSAVNKGGCIYHCGHENTYTNLYGGVFSGNTCSYQDATHDYRGSGAIYNSSVATGNTELTFSGNVKFAGAGSEGSGTDGLYLDSQNGMPRKIWISSTLTYPVKIFVKAIKGYVLAEGKEGHVLLRNRDMKQISFVNIDKGDEEWYAELYDDANQVKITDENPGYGLFVYYVGVDGKVVDDEEHKVGDTVTVKSGKGWTPAIPNEDKFLGWSKTEGGSTVDYTGGEAIKDIQEDLRLYAVYQKEGYKTLAADFYSGGAGQKETISEEVEETTPGVTIKAPELKEIDGWIPVGWAAKTGQFEKVDYLAGEDIELKEATTSFYGVYQKDVTLTYDLNGGIGELEPVTLPAYINVNSEISERPAEFKAAEGVPQASLEFMEWNTRADGKEGIAYKANAAIPRMEDLTLYAIYKNVATKKLAADFYSGEAGQKENVSLEVSEAAAGVAIEAPELKGMEGFTPMGWNDRKNGYAAEIETGGEVILEEPLSAYYGVYRRPYSLTYDANGGDDAARIVTDYCYANVHDEVTYQLARFVVGPGITREGYHFEGWNTRADGGGDTYIERDKIKVTGNATLYAKWAPDAAEYKVEHYRQEIDGSYTLEETEKLEAYTEDKVTASAKTYAGFTENISHGERVSSGIVKADGSLTLKLYYDRDIYEVAFHLNGAEGNTPEAQKLRYGTCLQTVDEPSRRGYTFGGWYLDEEGTAGREWEYGKPVEENFAKAAMGDSGKTGERNREAAGTGNDATGTDGSRPQSVTLYAKWVDDIAPVLGDTSFNQGYKNFLNWIIRQKDLIITVPITEEGSGVKQVSYSIRPDESAEGNAEATAGIEEMQYAAGKPERGNSANAGGNSDDMITGTLDIMEGRSSVERMNDVLSDRVYEDGFGMVQILVEDGQIVAELTIEEDFKGQVMLNCMDRAGNVSTEKTIAAEGGMIVEDNAPGVRFSSEDGKLSKTFKENVTVDVEVRDDVDKEGKGNVTGGISHVSYRIDSRKEKDVSEEEFQEEIVESCGFSVKVSGEGTHTLTVRASDHAGNESVESIKITIKKNPPAVTPPQENGPVENMPKGSEPKTGDFMHVEIYATAAMIAGLTYLLLYFMPEERGMTEEKKAELISGLVRWAENGSRIRKLPALIGIFFLLLYYHSIGKSVTVEWGERNII